MAISKIILNGEVQMDVTSDTVTAGSMLSGTTATKNDGTKATGTIASKSSSDLTASGATVTAPAGYYSANASKSVTTMTLPTTTSTSATSGYTSKATLDRSTSDRYLNIAPGYNSAGGYYKINKVANGSVTAPSSISGTSATVSTGTNTLTLTKTVSVTPNVTTAGYISSGTDGNSSVSLTASVTTKAAATITPSTSAQEIAAGTYLTGKQTIAAMPTGTAGTPTATKGTVSNHSVSVTPSVTNTTGYITGGTKTGTAVTVSASELVSGTLSITENDTGIDVTNYASVDVNVQQEQHTATIIKSGEYNKTTSKYCYVTYNGTRYYTKGETFTFTSGDTLGTTIKTSSNGKRVLMENGSVIAESSDAVGFWYGQYTMPNYDVEIHLGVRWSTTFGNINMSRALSSYKLIASSGISVSVVSTDPTSVSTIQTGDTSIWTSGKMVYIKIRDGAGARAGYFYGCDCFVYNFAEHYYPSVSVTNTLCGNWYTVNNLGVISPQCIYRVESYSAALGYGIYPTTIHSNGDIEMKARYSDNTGTINGNYIVDVYLLDWPGNIPIYSD